MNLNKLLSLLTSELFSIGSFKITILQIILLLVYGAIVMVGARLRKRGIAWAFARFSIQDEGTQRYVNRYSRQVYALLAFLLFPYFVGSSFSALADFALFEHDTYRLTVGRLLNALVILLGAQMLLWFVIEGVSRYVRRNNYDVGTEFAISQIVRYIIVTVSLLSAIQSLGFDLTLIWGGAAALAVGFGLGIQQTFNDLASGIFILLERSINVGDVLQMGETTGYVTKIGFRASEVVTRDNIVMLVPNSKLVTESVINWSHTDRSARFKVAVGVAYGSDTRLVKELLLDIANDHPQVLKDPAPNVLFSDFADSALIFHLLFWTSDFMRIDFIESDLRFAIDDAFRQHDIRIPFPQMDLWMRGEPADEVGQQLRRRAG